MTHPTSFAIIPAAGLSRRMGQHHKLLLPWDKVTVIDYVLRAWTCSQAERVIVVVRRDDAALKEACERWPVDVIRPENDPPDMKMSIRYGLDHVSEKYQPAYSSRWLVAPADLPGLSTQMIDRLITAAEPTDAIVVPRFGDRAGHPVSFPWTLSSAVDAIPEDRGINWLTANYRVHWLDLPVDERLDDIDTPQDYARLRKSLAAE